MGFPSTSLRPRVSSSSSLHNSNNSHQQHLTVETMEQPLPQQHRHHHPQTLNTSNSAVSATEGMNMNPDTTSAEGLPSEAQLVLLCLDHLRDLRRAYPAKDLQDLEGLNADYLSVAVYALSRCFTRPEELVHGNHNSSNDCMMDPMKQPPFSLSSPRHGSQNKPLIPSLAEMNHEILYVENPHVPDDEDDRGDQKKDDTDTTDPYTWYDYDDMHPSNVHRFYPLSGLASGPSLKGPLTLGEITAAGLAGLGARSRQDAERDMIQSALFEQFVQAVKSKGFFMDPDNDKPLSDPQEEHARIQRQQKNHDERYRKVVAKFRNKLAVKAETPSHNKAPALAGGNTANWLALSSADRQRRRREEALEQARWSKSGAGGGVLHHNNHQPPQSPGRHGNHVGNPSPRASPRVTGLTITPDRSSEGMMSSLSPRSPHMADNPIDVEGAEHAKAEGNIFMQKKLYPQAVEAYTQALKISPNGPHSHVYFSNRAAALLSMKKFGDAILDSERSLALKPDYGKAHARLGLAHFLCGNYRQSMEAYTVSLKYDPNNASSKSYLEKAAKRLAESGGSHQAGGPVQSSFSLVSEWESSQRQQQHSPSPRQGRSRRSPSPSPRRSSSSSRRQHQQSPSPGRSAPLPSQRSLATPNASMDNGNIDNDSNTQDQQRESEKLKAKGNAVS